MFTWSLKGGVTNSTGPDICHLCLVKDIGSEVKEFLKSIRRQNLKSIGDEVQIKANYYSRIILEFGFR